MRGNMRRKRNIVVFPLVCLLLVLLCVPAWAADGDYQGDFDYQGVIDPETGYAPGNAQTAAEKRVSISADMQYDRDAGMYVFTAGSGAELYCSAAEGMVVTEAVTLRSSGSLAPTVYRNGELIDPTAPDALGVPGDYVVYAGAEAGSRLCGFTVVKKTTNYIYNYTVPEGFLLRSVKVDGNDAVYSRYYVDMEPEGHYVITYRCPAAEREYTLDVVIDRTPPEIVLAGNVGRDGRVHSAVEISGLAVGDTISVVHDGSPETLPVTDGKATLTDTGAYTVTVRDAAGNSVSYEFTIMLYLNTNSIIFILLVIAVVASAFIYALWKRKRLKVR